MPYERIERRLRVLHELAEDISLEDILAELRWFYRAELEAEKWDPCPPYREVCEGALRALDGALWRLEADALCEDN